MQQSNFKNHLISNTIQAVKCQSSQCLFYSFQFPWTLSGYYEDWLSCLLLLQFLFCLLALLWYLRALVMEQKSACKCTTQDGSPLSVFVGAAKNLTLASKISRKGVPSAPGHSLPPKTISTAECTHFYPTKSPHRSMTAMNWDCRSHTPYSVLLLQHHRCGDKHSNRTEFLGWFWQARLGA